ncbi:MAG: PEP/pyruvate-binding domain-containing protein, partial [Bacteroidota bacterium]
YQSTEEIRQEHPFVEYIFKNSVFPPEAIDSFNKILDEMQGKPIVVRSSSLLEDSFEASFSGKYKSLFLSNTGTKEERLSALKNAIAEVYASTFAPDPIEYRKERGLLDFREEMGILIQEVVGTRIGKYYLPSYAGVAFSNNEFRWSTRIKREDGVIRLVAGLGTRAVDRTMDDYPILVCPGQPGLKVNTSYDEMVRYSQHNVDVINLETSTFETIDFAKLIKECKGNYPALEKIVSFNRMGTLVDPVSAMVDFNKEDIVVTFNNLVNRTNFINLIKIILAELREVYGRPVDIEFASDGEKLYLLQCRPQSQFEKEVSVKIPKNISPNSVVFTANHYVSNGIVENIEYVVYVDSTGYSGLETIEGMQTIGKIVSKLNRLLPRRKFILIGPGRWGSKGDIKLGVPILYSDINNTAMLIEVAKESAGYVPELSFGTHFFQDLVEANIKYLPLYPDREDNIFKDDFFYKTHNCLSELLYGFEEFENVVKLIKVESYRPDCTLSVFMDGDHNEAIAFTKKTNKLINIEPEKKFT